MTLFILLFIATILLWSFGIYLLWHIPLCSGERKGLNVAEGCSVIIPARNEEHNLPKLLRSLLPQLMDSDEIIVVNDHSTDATATVAGDNGAIVIECSKRPEGWTGKTWACWQGAQAARTDQLLFVDADTWFADGAFNRIVATRRKQQGMISIQPYHCMRQPFERLSLLFNCMVMIGVDAFSMHARHRTPAGSFGPCMACSRKDYFDVGGHKRVRNTVLENLALGPLFQQAGITVSCFGGRKTLYFRMYSGGVMELIEGWTKGFATGASRTPLRTIVLIAGWITGAFFSSGMIVASCIPLDMVHPAFAFIVYTLYCVQLYWMVRRIGNFGILSCLLLPVHLLFFTWIYLRSFVAIFIIKNVRWKGRTIRV